MTWADLHPIQYDAAVDQLFVRNGWTALWDGVRIGAEVLDAGVVTKNPQRPNTCIDASMRAIVAVTDGRDNNSADQHDTRFAGDGIDTTLDDLTDLAVFRQDVPVYAVGVGDEIDAPALAQLGDDTGGHYAHVDDYGALDDELAALSAQLGDSVPVCFDVSDDAVELRIEITVHAGGEDSTFEQVLAIPQDRCTAPDPTAARDYTPLRPLVPCSDELLEVLSDHDELLTTADLGCDPGPGAEPMYEQALAGDAMVRYLPPTADERAVLDDVLPELYAAVRTPDTPLEPLRARLAAADLAMHEYEVDGERFVVLFDTAPAWRGAGSYVLRRGPVDAEVIVQSPHTYHDEPAGTLAERLFSEISVRGVFFNTLQRDDLLPGATCTDQVFPADVAHVTNSFFYLMTTHYLTDVPDGTLVQLHGFSNPQLDEADVGCVLSAGSEIPSAAAVRLDDAIGGSLGGAGVALYPRDTGLYGATLNIQGRWVRAEQRGHFLHVELSRPVRLELAADAAARAPLAAAILAAAVTGE